MHVWLPYLMYTTYLKAQPRTRDERQLHEQSDVLQQKSAHKLVKPSRHRCCGGVAPNFWQTITNILAICMVSWIIIPPVDAVECCPNIENIV